MSQVFSWLTMHRCLVCRRGRRNPVLPNSAGGCHPPARANIYGRCNRPVPLATEPDESDRMIEHPGTAFPRLCELRRHGNGSSGARGAVRSAPPQARGGFGPHAPAMNPRCLAPMFPVRPCRKYAPSTSSRGDFGSDFRSTDSLFFQQWPMRLSGRSTPFQLRKACFRRAARPDTSGSRSFACPHKRRVVRPSPRTTLRLPSCTPPSQNSLYLSA